VTQDRHSALADVSAAPPDKLRFALLVRHAASWAWSSPPRASNAIKTARTGAIDLERLLKKPFRALAEAKARINAICANATPVISAMTEGFLDRG
jgi:hypothetical protein